MKNLYSREELRGLARKKARAFVTQTIPKTALEEFERDGWSLLRRNKKSLVISRPKTHDVLLEDQVWTLLYRMGFPNLSGEGGGEVIAPTEEGPPLANQIDVIAVDDEVILAVECKSALQPAKRQYFQGELAKHGLIRRVLSRGAGLPSTPRKRTVVLAIFTHNAILSDNDRQRAEQQQILLFDQDDLAYYQSLTSHLGPAARYQFLADLIPGRQVPGLTLRVPAIRAKMGGYDCFTFSISPDRLLKIAYVSHRAKGKASDLNTYQRMVSKNRLHQIAQYISDDGIFPTNIVVNFERGKSAAGLTFDKAKQEAESGDSEFGWLTIRPTYKSAWIIDGQHRLFAYSGHPRAASSVVSVLAFEGLPGAEQQRLFTDINAKQKSVKQSLLQELYADLHLDSANPAQRVQAIISRAIQALGRERDSPMFDRVLLADSARTVTRCISLNALFSALDRPGFYYGAVKKGIIQDPGPLWADDTAATIKRTITVLKAWFTATREPVAAWWDLGAAPGGGLAMNDGATVSLNVLRSVVEHLDGGKTKLYNLSTGELVDRLGPFASLLGSHFASFSEEERRNFRLLRGVQGQTAGVRHAQAYIQERLPEYQPEGLRDFLERERARTNDQASTLIREIETMLNETVIEELKASYAGSVDQWWYDGVPELVRRAAVQRHEEDKGKAGGREAYLDLIHYRSIIEENWGILGDLMGMGAGSKSKKTLWIYETNEIRKIAMHASRGASVSYDQLARLSEYRDALRRRTAGSTDEDQHDRYEEVSP